MESIPGFVFVPRPAGLPRPAGAFFSAVVEGPAGPGAWHIRLDGQVQTVRSDLPLVPGQTLRLRLLSSSPDTWVLQPWEGAAPAVTPGEVAPRTALLAAFLARGLPLAAGALESWSSWARSRPAPWDQAGWAASLDSRGWTPDSPVAAALTPWLEWQAALESGQSQPPPDGEEVWDLWNTRRPSGNGLWLAMPLKWEWEGRVDAGLLQARWNPASDSVDAWNLTAAPAGTGFRLEARPGDGVLDLTWRFFTHEDRQAWAPQAQSLGRSLSLPDLRVDLRIVGPEDPRSGNPGGGLDVQA